MAIRLNLYRSYTQTHHFILVPFDSNDSDNYLLRLRQRKVTNNSNSEHEDKRN